MSKNECIKISFAGDLVINENIYEILKNNSGKRKESFGIFNDSDLVIANLESPITSENFFERKAYNFKSPSEILNLFDNKFVFHLANNHIMDCGEKGLSDTITYLNERNFLHAGAGKNISEAAKPIIKKVKSFSVGIICSADPRFYPSSENKPGTLPADYKTIYNIIEEIKKITDIIIISVHSGIEFLKLPSPNQVSLASKLLSAGSDIVIFHHSHTYSGVTLNNNKAVIYGLGNYIFPFRHKFLKDCFKTAVYSITFSKDKSIEDFKIQPMIIGNDGIPFPAGKKSAELIKDIEKISRKISSSSLKSYIILAMINYNYFRVNLINYISIAKLNGFSVLFRKIKEGIKAQLKS